MIFSTKINILNVIFHGIIFSLSIIQVDIHFLQKKLCRMKNKLIYIYILLFKKSTYLKLIKC